jgi:subtilisin family serine protease
LHQNPFKYATDKGVIIVCSSGNSDSNDIRYPTSYEKIVSVTGLKKDHTARGDYGYGNYINFAMPAEKINSTSMRHFGEYIGGSGTSFAAPIVTAIISRILGNDPALTREQILEKLAQYSIQLPDGGTETGHGKIDAKSLALSYVDIEEKKVKTVINNKDVALEFKIVREKGTQIITRKVLEYLWINNKKYPVHQEVTFE